MASMVASMGLLWWLPGGGCLLQRADQEARSACKFPSAPHSPSQMCSGSGPDGHGPAPPPLPMAGRRQRRPGFGLGVLWELLLLLAPLAHRRLGGSGPGGPDLHSSPDPGSSAPPAAVASPAPFLSPPGRPTQPTSAPHPSFCHICSSPIQLPSVPPSAAGVAPLPAMAVPACDSTSSSWMSIPALGLRRLKPGRNPCSACRCWQRRHLRVPSPSWRRCHGLHPCALRASGETLGLVIRTGWRPRLDVIPLREGAVLFACGVPGDGIGDVGHLGLVWAASQG